MAKGKATAEGHRKKAVTTQWIASAKVALEKSGRTKKDVGEKCGASGPYLSQLFGGKYETSKFLDLISVELGIESPLFAVSTRDLQEIIDMASDFDDELMEHLKVIVRSMRALNKLRRDA